MSTQRQRSEKFQISLCDHKGKAIRNGHFPAKHHLVKLFERAGLDTRNWKIAKVSENNRGQLPNFVGNTDVMIAKSAAKPSTGIIALRDNGTTYAVFKLFVPSMLNFDTIHHRLHTAASKPEKHFAALINHSRNQSASKPTTPPHPSPAVTSATYSADDEYLLEAVTCFTAELHPRVMAAKKVLKELTDLRNSWQLTITVNQSAHSISAGPHSSRAVDVVALYDKIIGHINEFLNSKEVKFANAVTMLAVTYPQVLPVLPPETTH